MPTQRLSGFPAMPASSENPFQTPTFTYADPSGSPETILLMMAPMAKVDIRGTWHTGSRSSL